MLSKTEMDSATKQNENKQKPPTYLISVKPLYDFLLLVNYFILYEDT